MVLVHADMMALLRDPSPVARENVAAQLSHSFCRDRFTHKESQLAIDIFRLLVRDTAVQVRKAMADHLYNNPNVPRDIVMSLASDDLEVSALVLEHSLVLDDDDLLQFIEAAQEVEKWLAIARRAKLSRKVSLSLIATKHQKTISAVLENTGAALEEQDIASVLQEYKGSQNIMEALVCRGGLSPLIAEKIYTRMAVVLKKNLMKRQGFAWNATKDVAAAARDAMVIRFLVPHMTRSEIEEMLVQMHKNKRLSYALLIRALCYGEVYFFEAGMAELAGLSVHHARILMKDSAGQGVEAILQGKHMPSSFAKGLSIIYRTGCELTDHGKQRIADFSGRVIDHIYANGYHEKIENMPYFLSILKQYHVRHTLH